MRVRLRWQKRKEAEPVDCQLERFRKVLLAALETEWYRPVLEKAGIGARAEVDSLRSISEALPRFPPLDLADYRESLAQFLNPRAPEPEPQRLRCFFEPAPKIAVLLPGFEQSAGVRVFASDWTRKLEKFHAEVIAAPLEVLRHLARSIQEGRVAVPPLTHAVVPFTGIQEGLITEQDRELFWRAFQVPVYEQFLGFDGRLVAWECEAHVGLHVEAENAFLETHCRNGNEELLLTSLTDLRHPALRLATGFQGLIIGGECGCGSKTRRLADVQRVSSAQRQAAACFAD